MLHCTPQDVCMDLTMRSYQNGTVDLPMLSRGYATLVDQATPIDQAFNLEKLGKLPRLYQPTRTIIPTIPSCPSAESSSQTQPREARPYGKLQVPT